MHLKRIISYSLFGADENYRVGAIENCALAQRFFPGWICLVYVSDQIAVSVAEELERACAKVVIMRQRAAYDGLYWRFLPAADPSIDALIVRDADALLGPREKTAVDRWIESGKALHVIRDHPGHRRLIQAGLWGCRGNVIPEMAELIEAFGRDNGFDSRTGDADFLEHLYSRLRSDMFVHSAFSYFPGETPEMIPMPREGNEWLGCPVARDPEMRKRELAFEKTRTMAKSYGRCQTGWTLLKKVMGKFEIRW
jgi:hypothetical protein